MGRSNGRFGYWFAVEVMVRMPWGLHMVPERQGSAIRLDFFLRSEIPELTAHSAFHPLSVPRSFKSREDDCVGSVDFHIRPGRQLHCTWFEPVESFPRDEAVAAIAHRLVSAYLADHFQDHVVWHDRPGRNLVQELKELELDPEKPHAVSDYARQALLKYGLFESGKRHPFRLDVPTQEEVDASGPE